MIRVKEPAKGKGVVRQQRTAAPSAGGRVVQPESEVDAKLRASKEGEKVNTGAGDPLMAPVLIAFTVGQKGWLDAEATSRKCRRSEVVRALVDEAMAR